MQAINFTRGVPADESFPIQELIDASRLVLKTHGSQMLQYGPVHGFEPLRQWIAQWQGVNTDQVIISNGSLQLFDLFCIYLLKPDDVVFVESPTYDRSLAILKRRSVKVVGVPIQEDGPDMGVFESELKKRTPKFFYTIPEYQNPSGSTCSEQKRRQIVELAKKHNFWIVEDSPYRLLRYKGQEYPTIYGMAPDRTLHMSSFTKLVAPGVRVGFMLGPSSMIDNIASVAVDTYISPGYEAQAVIWQWCQQGLLKPQLKRINKLYAPRLEACLHSIDKYLPDVSATRPNGGYFVSITLPKGVSTVVVRELAAKNGLNLSDGRGFFPDGGGDRFLRLPFCALNPEQIEEGIQRLSSVVHGLS